MYLNRLILTKISHYKHYKLLIFITFEGCNKAFLFYTFSLYFYLKEIESIQ